jgi:hypothetical protein
MKLMKQRHGAAIGVADEVWVAAALLQRASPRSPDFTIKQIVDRAAQEGLHEELRRGVYVHVVQHCVANRPPNPGRYRMLYETRRGYRRLFRPGDDWHPARQGGRTRPAADSLPKKYLSLLEWYDQWTRLADPVEDSILALRGLGRQIWQDQTPDDYVAGLRRGWE